MERKATIPWGIADIGTKAKNVTSCDNLSARKRSYSSTRLHDQHSVDDASLSYIKHLLLRSG